MGLIWDLYGIYDLYGIIWDLFFLCDLQKGFWGVNSFLEGIWSARVWLCLFGIIMVLHDLVIWNFHIW